MQILDVDAYLNTRVTLFAKRLFTAEQIEQLPQLDSGEIARRYGINAVQEHGALPVGLWLRALESALMKSMFDVMDILVRPMDEHARGLVMQWARKFELFNLKALIRGKLSGMSEAEIEASLHDLPAYLSLPYQPLMRSESVLEMLRLLERAGHKELAGQARQIYEEHGEAFLLEATIDQQYFKAMIELVDKISFSERREVRDVVGLQIDRVNLVLMLRYLFAYQLSPSEVYYYLAPSPKYLTKAVLTQLLSQPTLEDLLAHLPAPLARELAGADNIPEVERRMYAMTVRELRRVLAEGQSGVARTLAYLVLSELDLKRLFTVVQGQLLKLDTAVVNLALGIQPAVPQT